MKKLVTAVMIVLFVSSAALAEWLVDFKDTYATFTILYSHNAAGSWRS